MITVDLTMVIHIINIFVLIAVMNAVLYRPVRGIIRKRKEEIASMESSIETFEKNAKLRMQELEQKLNDARNKAKEQLEGVKREAQDASNEKVGAVRTEADAQKTVELEKVQAQYSAAEQSLKGELDNFASDMAGKILGRAI